ncbi:MAG: hypothetical protein IJW00_11135 [Clostridia bacterium]|nr:hypothetical protein [Clostridia bacterium]MBQ9781480.1 hypothetical protein [Clostridia bacterium]
MAEFFDREPADKKASSLSGDTLTPLSRTSGKAGKRGKKEKSKDRIFKGNRRTGIRGVVVDLVILLLLAGVGVGLWFGYTAVKDLYAPVWQSRNVEFCVEIKNIDYDRADQLLPALSGHDLWSSADVSGDRLGIVTDVRAVPVITEDGRETMTLYLTVRTEARYRKGEGYYADSTRLLAGESSIFRAEGLIAEGTVVSLKDLTEVDA